jgi:DNA processing protein
VPAANQPLARRILRQGGALVSEYDPDDITYKQNFVARNRLVSGLADALLITEASEKSGSLHTARFALEQGRDVFAVPGNITGSTSVGTNNLIKSGHAAAATSYKDVLNALGLKDIPAQQTVRGSNAQEQTMLDLLLQGISDGAELLEQSRLPVNIFNQTLTMLEIGGLIHPLGANQWSLR